MRNRRRYGDIDNGHVKNLHERGGGDGGRQEQELTAAQRRVLEGRGGPCGLISHDRPVLSSGAEISTHHGVRFGIGLVEILGIDLRVTHRAVRYIHRQHRPIAIRGVHRHGGG